MQGSAPSISPTSQSAFPEGGFPYCQRARQILAELQRHSQWLPNYDEEGVRSVLEECKRLEEQMLALPRQENGDDDVDPKVSFSRETFRLCINRNKRILLAYFQFRNGKIEDFYWETSAPVMPKEFAQKLSAQELAYYTHYQKIVSRTMEKMDMNVLAHRMPPGSSLFVQVRVLQECGEVILQSGVTVSFVKNSKHYLRREDVEHLIRQRILEEV